MSDIPEIGSVEYFRKFLLEQQRFKESSFIGLVTGIVASHVYTTDAQKMKRLKNLVMAWEEINKA